MIKKIKLYLGLQVAYFLVFLSRLFKIDLLTLAHREIGIGKSHSFEASGEKFLIEQWLPSIIKNNNPVLIDIGANIGNYSELLALNFKNGTIYSFEPNPETFKIFKKKTEQHDNIVAVNSGVGDKSQRLKLYTSKKNLTSVNSSTNYEALLDVFPSEEITSLEIELISLNSFMTDNKIKHIDFLKIDTEGFEFEILTNIKNIIYDNKIGIIQFEFNEVSLKKRTFLSDYYKLLSTNYNLYRLNSNKLIPLGTYKPIYEIFLFQNIIAVNKEIFR